MKNQLHTKLSLLALCSAIMLPTAFAEDKKEDKGEKPTATPGWIVIEDDFWYPWAFEPIYWFDSAESHYRQRQEKAAASELRKAESWLNFAATHAQPITKKSLDEASAALKALADDLDKGKIGSMRDLDSAMVKANKALAEWHYFKADQNLAKSEEKDAAQNLQAAARYLKKAADSARYQYGSEFVSVYDDLFGWTVTDVVPNTLKSNLAVVKTEIGRLAATLKKDSETK